MLLNKQGKFGVKIFLHYVDIVIFALGHFTLPHHVNVYMCFYVNKHHYYIA